MGFRRVGSRLDFWALLLYVGISIAFFGPPVLGHIGSKIVARGATDPEIFMWTLGWWPHAILHGENPLFTHAIFAPYGYNMGWATAIAGPALLMSPVTLAFGPVVSFNVTALLAPGVAAWTAFLLCRHVTGSVR